MDIKKYKHIKFGLDLNKNMIPVNNFTFEDVHTFNQIYRYINENYPLTKSTPSGGISNDIKEKYSERYFIVKGNQRFEIVLISLEGCYRFLIQNKRTKDNTVSGQESCRAIYKFADAMGIDMSKYAVSIEEGKQIKKEIEPPHIECLMTNVLRRKLKHIYHLDFKSSYASRIAEAYPELRDMFRTIFLRRKENDGYYKHVLTNSIGCWQSPFCIDYNTRHRVQPFQFALLSKIAINGTRSAINRKLKQLNRKGMIPILTNTDGIWYYSDHGPYHDKDEGNDLGCWENDHIDCQFLMTSVGAYQYVENGKCTTVVRGLCNLDLLENDREKWQFGDILKINQLLVYEFDKKKGLVKINED